VAEMPSLFSSFWLKPEGFSFPTQEQGEKIILLLRAHLVTLLSATFFVSYQLYFLR
jgi:hypothetical protein